MMEKALLKQECPLAFVVLAWTMYVAGIPVLFALGQVGMMFAWIVLAPVAMWAYVHWFPSISRFMGYGRVDDRPAGLASPANVEVTVYTALGCPFCPIVKRRLTALEPKLGFHRREVDVTARPGILISKGIWSVPVVEVGDRRIVGHATTERLAELIAGKEPATTARPYRLSTSALRVRDRHGPCALKVAAPRSYQGSTTGRLGRGATRAAAPRPGGQVASEWVSTGPRAADDAARTFSLGRC